MRFLFLAASLFFCGPAWSKQCDSDIGIVEIIEDIEVAKNDLVQGATSVYEFDKKHGNDAANSILVNDYLTFLASIGCNPDGSKTSVVKSKIILRSVAIEKENLIKLCTDNIPAPLILENKQIALVATLQGVLAYSGLECRLMRYK